MIGRRMRHGLRSGAGQAADPIPPENGTGAITRAGEGAGQPVQKKQEKTRAATKTLPRPRPRRPTGRRGQRRGPRGLGTGAAEGTARPGDGPAEADEPTVPAGGSGVPRWLQRAAGWSWRLLLVGLVIYLAFRVASVLRLVVSPVRGRAAAHRAASPRAVPVPAARPARPGRHLVHAADRGGRPGRGGHPGRDADHGQLPSAGQRAQAHRDHAADVAGRAAVPCPARRPAEPVQPGAEVPAAAPVAGRGHRGLRGQDLPGDPGWPGADAVRDVLPAEGR